MGQAYITRRGAGGMPIRVKAYTSAGMLDERATRNTLGVITNLEIGHTYAGGIRPAQPQTGDLWIELGTGEELGILAGNESVMLGIVHVEQYDAEQWKSRESYAWTGEAWIRVSVDKIYLYDRGTENTELTGGWVVKKDGGTKITFEEKAIVFEIIAGGSRYVSVYTTNKIDMGAYSTLGMIVSNACGVGDDGKLYLAVVREPYTGVLGDGMMSAMFAGISVPVGPARGFNIVEERAIECNIASVMGEHYIQFAVVIADAEIHEIYLK